MEHLAILNKHWGMLPKILSGEKTIESRWYLNKRCPWNQISSGDTIYFKNNGESVSLSAEVGDVLQFNGLTSSKIDDILSRYGRKIGIEPNQFSGYHERFKGKKYCILIFLKKAQMIEPFKVDKLKVSGYCLQSAWVSLENIDTIKV